MSYTFKYQDKTTVVTVETHHVTWPELLQSFYQFLLGCGFVVQPEDVFVQDACLACESEQQDETKELQDALTKIAVHVKAAKAQPYTKSELESYLAAVEREVAAAGFLPEGDIYET